MKRTAIGCLASTIFVMGCAMESEQPYLDEPIGDAEEPILGANALAANALAANALAANALAANALAANSLTYASLATTSQDRLRDPGPDGVLARAFLKYAVLCAFTPSQHFTFSWTDADSVLHSEDFAGEVGLAPEWRTGSMDTASQEWVSACLASRTNYYGVSVVISMRGSKNELSTTLGEQLNYLRREGAFWGNLFAPTPAAYACYYEPNVDHSRYKMRDCATGHVNGSNIDSCGVIEILGSCDNVCDLNLLPIINAYPSCDEKSHVITTYLE